MSYPPAELKDLTERELLLLTCQRVQDMHGDLTTTMADVEDLKREKWVHRGMVLLIAFLASIFGPNIAAWFSGTKAH